MAVVVTFLVSMYMLLSPAHWVRHTMQLTKMSWDYKLFLFMLGFAYLMSAWIFERHLSQHLAKQLGKWKEKITGKSKQRKAYKVIEDQMKAC